MTIEEHIADAVADIARIRASDPKTIAAVLRVLVKHERELCAQIAEDEGKDFIAEQIRARGRVI
jgi:hypothetical protein